ncbi:MAG: hypothetical protein KKF56_00495 [Nanoarchaeota archaeon]|nr:hypothetical protein [Nanoarchaeota archaeon]
MDERALYFQTLMEHYPEDGLRYLRIIDLDQVTELFPQDLAKAYSLARESRNELICKRIQKGVLYSQDNQTLSDSRADELMDLLLDAEIKARKIRQDRRDSA